MNVSAGEAIQSDAIVGLAQEPADKPPRGLDVETEAEGIGKLAQGEESLAAGVLQGGKVRVELQMVVENVEQDQIDVCIVAR